MACCIYFKQEHMHITYFFIVNFEHVFFSCALKNRAISSKHVPVTWVKQHCLNNPKTIESNVHIIIVTGHYLGEGWAG